MGELITFENTNPALDTLAYYQVGNSFTELGQSLDVTRSAFDQPELGGIPAGSFLFAWFEAPDTTSGDWIFMGQGRNTQIGQALEHVDVTDPYTFQSVGHPGPEDYGKGQEIGESSLWAPSWLAIHAINSQTPDGGVFFTDESFTIGVRFELDDGVHFGFAEMTRTGYTHGDPLSIGYHPVRWGYETTPGVSVPGAGTLWTGSLIMLCSRRRR